MGHPAVQDIAQQDDAAAGYRSQMESQGKQIQQRLAGMSMPAVSSIEHMPLIVVGDKVGYPRAAVANDDNESAQRRKRSYRIY